MENDYYTSGKRKLLKEFDRALDRIRGVFVSRYSGDAEEMVHEARQECEALISQLPYVGGRQPFTQFLIPTAWFLSMYRALKHPQDLQGWSDPSTSLRTGGIRLLDESYPFQSPEPRIRRALKIRLVPFLARGIGVFRYQL